MKKIFLTLLGIISIGFLIKPLLTIVIDDEIEDDSVDEDRTSDQF
ncbi:hypothetical protein [Staphylococcus edaphicus]|nr:hypothetical protein [Staphylococcus edaphicus]